MFDIHQEVFKDGDWSDEDVQEYCQGLCAAFDQSPEGQACREHLDELGWTDTFLYYGLAYCGKTPPRMSRGNLEEVLFELIPRKVSTSAESAEAIVTELRAFWEFLSREYELPQAAAFANSLDGKATCRLERELSNPANFGMAKSILMLGDKLGFDMTTQEGLDEFMVRYNRALGAMPPPSLADDAEDDEPDPRFQPNATVPRRIAQPVMPQRTADERRAMTRARQKQLQAIKRRRK
jgi:hypothetical protein